MHRRESVMAAPGNTPTRSRHRQAKLPALNPSRLLPLDEALRLARSRALDHLARGLAQQRWGNGGGALADFEAAIRWQPRNAEFLVQRGLARLGCLDLAEAVIEACRDIRIDAREVWAYYQHR